jgi:DNA-binding NarL/FixJ family response regulator
MDNSSRFQMYLNALKQFYSREGHCLVPAIHIEILEGKEIFLGAWIGYARQRKKKNQLPENRIKELEEIPGWQWGPLRPGPATDKNRNNNILEMRAAGHSLRQIADEFELSRQRIHQIVKKIDVSDRGHQSI